MDITTNYKNITKFLFEQKGQRIDVDIRRLLSFGNNNSIIYKSLISS